MENHERRMVQLYSPRSEPELMILKSVFDEAGIRYFVRNDTFGSLYAGPHIESYNRKILCVWDVELEEATALVDEFLERTGRSPAPGTRAGLTTTGILGRLLQRFSAWLEPPPPPEPPRFRLIRSPGPVRRGPDRRRPPLRLVARR